jgi:hypothetical protein
MLTFRLYQLLRLLGAALGSLLGARVPMGEYWLWKLLRRQALPKLNESRCSLCSFLGGALYLGRGMGSPGL